jgi:endo-1,4-beta-xylanase
MCPGQLCKLKTVADLFSHQGVTDKYSWVPNTFSGEGDALLWNSNYQKKAAYTSFLQGITSGGSSKA